MKIAKHIFRVLVFPSSNEPGLEIVHCLEKSNKVVLFGGSSTDVDYDPSKLLLKRHMTFPYFKDKGFKQKFLEICNKYRINFVYPTVDALVEEFASWKNSGVTFIVPNLQTARLVMSKRLLYKKLHCIVPVPKLYISSGSIPLPVFGKPDRGSGARESMLVSSLSQLAIARQQKLLLCEYLPGEEYTVDAVNDKAGNLLFFNPRLRAKIGRSISLGTKSIESREIAISIEKIVNTIQIEGPWFAQFKRDSNGILKLMEINCRIGGSAVLSRIAGVNIPLISLFIYAGYDVSVPTPRKNILVNRFLTNICKPPKFSIVIWDLMGTLINKSHKVDPDIISYLYDFSNRNKRQVLFTKTKKVKELLVSFRIPNVFTDVQYTPNKIKAVQKFIKTGRFKPNLCVVINDSNQENLRLQQEIPGIITVTPESIAFLGREPT